MRFVKNIFLVIFLLSSSWLHAQINVQGTVLDVYGEALPFATVSVRGTTNGTITDVKGAFSLNNLNETDTIQASFVGYLPEFIVVGSQTNITFNLVENLETLDEVIVVGFGTQRKLNVTGSVVSISSEKLENRGVTNVSNMLAGNTPGLTVLQRGGSPGRNGGSIRIRGIGTLGEDAKSDPLIIVDGIETGSLQYINPNDIENVSVLKDAAASAIYGVRAANGVIIVTTKRGESGKPAVSYGFQFGFSNPVNLPEKVNSAELAQLYSEAEGNEGLKTRTFSPDDIDLFESGESLSTHANSNQLDKVFNQTGIRQVHNLSISGGAEKVRYNVSLGYTDEQGNMVNTDHQRYNFRSNLDIEPTDKLKFGLNLAGSQRNITEPIVGVGGIIHRAYREWATDPLQTQEGNWALPEYGQTSGVVHNGVGLLNDGGTKQFVDSRFTGTIFAEYDLFEFLSVKGVAATVLDFNRRKETNLSYSIYNLDESLFNSERSRILEGRDNIIDQNLQLLINFNKEFGDHHVTALLGINSRKIESILTRMSVFDLRSNELDQISAGDLTQDDLFGNATNYGLMSYFGRVNYSLKDKYLFEANLRYDGTSRFAEENRFHAFPSFSVGWRLSEETFFDFESIYDLKLRASWGLLGNQEIGNYRYQNIYVFDQTAFLGNSEVSGSRENLPVGNPDILWESTEVINYGLDLSLLKGSLNLTGEYFIRSTSDVLIQKPLPAVFGSGTGTGNFPFVNAAATQNRGYEISAFYTKIFNENLKITTSANFSRVKTTIKDLAGTDQPGFSVGDPIANIYGYEAIGIFQNQDEIDSHADQSGLGTASRPGDIKYSDLNNDGLITPDDRHNLGSFFPEINYGFSFNLTYKKWDFGMLWQGVGDVVGEVAGRQRQPFWFGSSPWDLHLDRAQIDRDGNVKNPDAKYPRTLLSSGDKNYQTSSWWVQSTAFLKLRNVQIGYKLPKNIIQRAGIQSLRIYVSGENLLTFTKFEGFDPEIPSSGNVLPTFSGDGGYPVTRTFLVGLNLTF